MRFANIMTTMSNSDNLMVRDVPVISTIVEFDDHSLAIIDTGMADNPELLEQLDDMGYKPSDFSLVINTHLHPDHIGGNRHFSNARILISRQDLAFQQSGCWLLHQSGQPCANPLKGIGLAIEELFMKYPVSELVGDPEQIEFQEDGPGLPPEIQLIPVPGHSIDDHAVVLRGKTRKALVAGDALYHRDLWRQPSLPGLNFSEEAFRRSAAFISEFMGIIVPGHDRVYDNMTGIYLKPNRFIQL